MAAGMGEKYPNAPGFNFVRQRQPAPQRPIWGFHEPTVTAGEAMGPIAQGAGQVLSDPRNSWMGLGPIAGMAAMGRNLGFRGMNLAQSGGFNSSTSTMRRAMPDLLGTPEPDLRSQYMERMGFANQFAKALDAGDESAHQLLKENPELADLARGVMSGQARLQGQVADMMDPLTGGGVPPKWFKPEVPGIAGANARPNTRR